jgi:hypothetical protein
MMALLCVLRGGGHQGVRHAQLVHVITWFFALFVVFVELSELVEVIKRNDLEEASWPASFSQLKSIMGHILAKAAAYELT